MDVVVIPVAAIQYSAFVVFGVIITTGTSVNVTGKPPARSDVVKYIPFFHSVPRYVFQEKRLQHSHFPLACFITVQSLMISILLFNSVFFRKGIKNEKYSIFES